MAEPTTCRAASCADEATHWSGWGNRYVSILCVGHTRFRETLGAWSRGMKVLP